MSPSLKLILTFFNTTPKKIGVIGGLCLLLLILIWQEYDSGKYSFAASSPITPTSKEKKIASVPTFLNIPSLELGLYTTDMTNWQMAPVGVSHLKNSSYPGESGNIIMYGRNTEEELGGITTLKKGDLIRVVTKDGIRHDYIITEKFSTTPSDKTVLEDTPLETLTLFMPVGFGNTKRFVIRAVPASNH